MLQIFPFLVFLAPLTAAVLLVVLWSLGELAGRSLGVLLVWFLLAAYCEFLAGSAIVRAVGLLCQTMLAIYLILRWRLSY